MKNSDIMDPEPYQFINIFIQQVIRTLDHAFFLHIENDLPETIESLPEFRVTNDKLLGRQA
jgi:hypothetical protein